MSVELEPQIQQQQAFPPQEGMRHLHPLQQVPSEEMIGVPPIPNAPKEVRDAYHASLEKRQGNEEVGKWSAGNGQRLGISTKQPLSNGETVTGPWTPEQDDQRDREAGIHTQASVIAGAYDKPANPRAGVREIKRKSMFDHPSANYQSMRGQIDTQASGVALDSGIERRMKEHIAWEREARKATDSKDERLAEFSRDLTPTRWRPLHAVRGLTRAVRHRKGAR